MAKKKQAPKVLTDADFQDDEPKVLTDDDFQDSEPGGGAQAPESSLSERLQAAMGGLEQGVTFGYGPHLEAAIEPLVSKAVRTLGGYPKDKTMGNYVQRRDENIKLHDDMRAQNPTEYGVGELGGSIASGLALPGGKLMQTAKLPGKIALGIGTGAAIGGLSNPGDEKGVMEPLQLSQRFKNAGLGAALSGAAPVVGEGLSRVGQGLKKMSARSSFKALGPYARDTIKAYDKGTVERIGDTLMDEKVVGGFPKSHEKLADMAQEASTRKGVQIDQYLNELSDAEQRLLDQTNQNLHKQTAAQGTTALSKPGTNFDVPVGGELGSAKYKPQTKIGVNRQKVADSMRDELINMNTDIPGVARQNARMEQLIRQFEAGKDDVIPVLKAERLKRSTGKEINWNRLPDADIPLEEEVQRKLYSKLKTGVEDAGTFLEEHVGAPKVGKFKKLKEQYGDLDTAHKIADRRESREMANRFLSPSDYFVGGLGTLIGGAMGDDETTPEDRIRRGLLGGSLAFANRTARLYGNQVSAPLMRKMSKGSLLLGKEGPKALRNPWSLLDKEPQDGEK